MTTEDVLLQRASPARLERLLSFLPTDGYPARLTGLLHSSGGNAGLLPPYVQAR
jgi:hypothetical protein